MYHLVLIDRTTVLITSFVQKDVVVGHRRFLLVHLIKLLGVRFLIFHALFVLEDVHEVFIGFSSFNCEVPSRRGFAQVRRPARNLHWLQLLDRTHLGLIDGTRTW